MSVFLPWKNLNVQTTTIESRPTRGIWIEQCKPRLVESLSHVGENVVTRFKFPPHRFFSSFFFIFNIHHTIIRYIYMNKDLSDLITKNHQIHEFCLTFSIARWWNLSWILLPMVLNDKKSTKSLLAASFKFNIISLSYKIFSSLWIIHDEVKKKSRGRAFILLNILHTYLIEKRQVKCLRRFMVLCHEKKIPKRERPKL